MVAACQDFLAKIRALAGQPGPIQNLPLPTDDPVEYPYLHLRQPLLCRSLEVIAGVLQQAGQLEQAEEALARSFELKAEHPRAVHHHGTSGAHVRLGGERLGRSAAPGPTPGSLRLLAYYGFCPPGSRLPQYGGLDPLPAQSHYIPGHFGAPACEHAPYPWVSSLCYELITGDSSRALEQLISAELDNDLACETIDPETGGAKTGAAFAT